MLIIPNIKSKFKNIIQHLIIILNKFSYYENKLQEYCYVTYPSQFHKEHKLIPHFIMQIVVYQLRKPSLLLISIFYYF